MEPDIDISVGRFHRGVDLIDSTIVCACVVVPCSLGHFWEAKGVRVPFYRGKFPVGRAISCGKLFVGCLSGACRVRFGLIRGCGLG